MEESYVNYIVRHLADAESALFEARNAYMGTNDLRARKIEQMRRAIVDMLHDEKRKAAR